MLRLTQEQLDTCTEIARNAWLAGLGLDELHLVGIEPLGVGIWRLPSPDEHFALSVIWAGLEGWWQGEPKPEGD